VKEEYRSRGIGGRLLAEVQRQARLKGYEKIYLGTNKEHMRQWYGRLGWKKVGKAWNTKLNQDVYDVFEFDLRKK
jgi:N-acetylglutamate synthase-like GNAT family acetyltransferase